MNELEKLKLQLKNLKESGHQEFTINVKYLSDILNTLPTQSDTSTPSVNIDFDGGKFASK
jgi:hypothetical protein